MLMLSIASTTIRDPVTRTGYQARLQRRAPEKPDSTVEKHNITLSFGRNYRLGKAAAKAIM